MPSFSILWKGTFVETRALTRSEDVVRAGVHGGEGEELLSCLLSLNIEPKVVLVPKRLHMLLKDAFAVHFGTEGAELTNQLLGFKQITPKLSSTKFFDKTVGFKTLGMFVCLFVCFTADDRKEVPNPAIKA